MRVLVLTAMAAAALAGPVRAEMTCKTIGNVTSCETPGSLAPTQNRGCIGLEDADATMSPADLAVSALACAKANKTTEAAELMALMSARGRFDAERVTDRTAHQGIQVLRYQVSGALPERKAKALQDALNDLLTDLRGKNYTEFCSRVSHLGVPKHDPSYMIAHGIKAFSEDTPDPLVAGFNAEAAWDMVMRDYMKCPK